MVILSNGHSLINRKHLLDLTLVIHNWIISYDTARYHNIKLNVAVMDSYILGAIIRTPCRNILNFIANRSCNTT